MAGSGARTVEVPTLPAFARTVLALDLSPPQDTLLHAIAGLPLPNGHLEHWTAATERTSYEPQDWREIMVLCGRQSGKSDIISATVACYYALFRKQRDNLSGRQWCAILAQDLDAAKGVTFDYCLNVFEKVGKHYRRCHRSPIRSHTKSEIILTNGVGIGCWPCNTRAIRGRRVLLAACDELAHWRDADRYANPASEVLRAIRPAMSTIKRPKLIMATTPYTKTGVVWETWRKRHTLKRTLVFRATSEQMNPFIDRERMEEERESDPDNYRREYLAEFTDAINAFLAWSELEPCILAGVQSVPRGQGSYRAAMDPSSRRNDSWTMAVGHAEGDVTCVDLLTGWGPGTLRSLSTEDLLDEAAAICKQYGVQEIFTDQYGYEFLKDGMRRRGLMLKEYPLSQPSKAKMYLDFKAKILAGNYRMPEHKQAIGELVQLEERLTGGGGRKFQAPEGGHDDYADVCAMLAHQLGSAGEIRIRRLG